jgi:peptidoglycan/LPS O-acetylase OafA/YrhL
LQYLATILALLVWRRARPQAERPYRLPVAPLTAGLALAAVIFLLYHTLSFYWREGLGALLVGFLLTLSGPRREAGSPAKEDGLRS